MTRMHQRSKRHYKPMNPKPDLKYNVSIDLITRRRHVKADLSHQSHFWNIIFKIMMLLIRSMIIIIAINDDEKMIQDI